MKLSKETVLSEPIWKWFAMALIGAIALEAGVIGSAALVLKQLLS